MSQHNVEHPTKFRSSGYLIAIKHRHHVTKQPWFSETSTTNHYAITARLAHHFARVSCFPNIAITKNRNISNGVLQLSNRLPSGIRRIVLLGGSRMQRNRSNTGFLTNQAGVNVGQQVVVQADSKLASHRYAKRRRRLDSRINNFAQKIFL